MRTSILGVGVDSLTMEQAVECALRLVDERRGAYVCTPNPELLWLCQKDAALRDCVNGAALVLPDGVGVLLGARLLGQPLPERVTGFDFVCVLLGRMQGRVFLLGGKPGVAERAAQMIGTRFPNVTVVDVCDGYFTDTGAVIRRIEAAKPDFLMVCLGMGKQERFMAQLAGSHAVGLMAGLGGTLDVLAGDIPRAPELFIRCRLEWLYRLGREPRRIGRVMRLPLYLAAVVRQGLRYGKADRS